MADHDTLAPDALSLATSCLDRRASFLVEAGAGSGKTSTLVRALHHLLGTYRDDLELASKQIVCITYTNVAKNEIIERIAADPLVLVFTIHEFLWSVMQQFQIELRTELVAWNDSESRRPIEDLGSLLAGRRIVYSDRGRRIDEGQITHDDVIVLAARLFKNHPKIAKITTSRYPYLLVDEYQDTHRPVVELLLDSYTSVDTAVVGFFGDSMQNIYRTGIGRLESDKLQVITKPENFRCSRAVISVLNRIRPELKQTAAGANADGSVYFFGGDQAIELGDVRSKLESVGWSPASTKILMLTHKGIAGQMAYPSLLDAYDKRGSFDRDHLIEGDDPFIVALRSVHDLVRAYNGSNIGQVAEILRRQGFRFRKHADKAEMLKKVGQLAKAASDGRARGLLNTAFELGLMEKSDGIRRAEDRPEKDNPTDRDLRYGVFLNALDAVPFTEVTSFFDYLEGSAPFFTQHGVKGAEYENVLVAIDDTAWNLYNMGNMLAGVDNSRDRISRSKNLFYVCCSRAISGLAVAFLTPPPAAALGTARDWFGEENVYASA